MRVLIDHHLPFSLAHGGLQVQVEQTRTALQALDVKVEFLRWWDAEQKGDLIHCFGSPGTGYLNQARLSGLPVVITTTFSETCNRSAARLAWQGTLVNLLLSLPFGEGVKQQLTWRSYQICAQNIVGLAAEKAVLQTVYRVPEERISIVPLGLSDAFLKAGTGGRQGAHLICSGTIAPVKNSVALARLARAAQVPVLFVGKPYAANDGYWREFQKLVDGQWVKYHPHVATEAEMAALLHAARGFVLFSKFENWSLAAHEAAACGLPLLLPGQKWSRERFGTEASYFTGTEPGGHNAEVLRRFYAEAPQMAAPRVRFDTWEEVARKLVSVYERVLSTSR